ncbi:hypothetical protein, partial [Streptomyces acidiscabies]|uniref:hypothetical protein n=1 Tax=Streptomyces acidiscabies TaxID=42234 RepID=UPI00117DD584
KLLLADGETSRTACARALIRTGVDEKTSELLTAAALVERVGWLVLYVGADTACRSERGTPGFPGEQCC